MSEGLPVGTVLGGYRVERLLGRGGMGVVYLAEHLTLNRRVALKVVAPEIARDEGFRERFLREARLAASLDDPHIIPVYDAGEDAGELFLAMRFVEGTDLRRVIDETGALESGRAVSIVAQAAGALDAAHAEGLVHRDVKPGNLLIAAPDRQGTERAFLTDFGLTKRRASESSSLTRTGMFLGTLDYAAPEQLQAKPLDGRADQYALACVLYESLTGQRPFARETDAQVMYAHLMDAPPAPSDVRAELGRAIDAVIARAMEKEPAARFDTCAEFAEAARSALTATDSSDIATGEAASPTRAEPPVHAVTAAPPAPVALQRESPAGGKRRWPLFAGAAATLVAVAVLAVVLLSGGGTKPSTAPTTGGSSGSPGQNLPDPATAAPGTVLFRDSFDTKAGGWNTEHSDKADFGYSGGVFRFRVFSKEAVGALLHASSALESIDDVVVSADVTQGTAFRTDAFGISCRAALDGQSDYDFILFPTGTFEILRFQNGDFQSLASGSDSIIKVGRGATNHIEGTCVGSKKVRLSMKVNGKAVGSATDIHPLPSGAPAMGVGAQKPGLEVTFDNFVVRKP